MTGYTNPYAGMTTEQLEAAFTAEDPRYPARKVASETLHKFINEWIEGYEVDDGESRPHAPSEFERFLILDAFHGLTSDEDYQRLDAAWRALCGPVPAGVAACGKCPGCVTGNLLPYDHKGLPMARCDNCGLEVNDATRGVPRTPAGYALVPLEPTPAMFAADAPEDERPDDFGTMKYRRGIWKAMLRAAGVKGSGDVQA